MKRPVAIATISVAALLGVVGGASAKPAVIKRCGFIDAKYGRSAIYPWHMSCSDARKVIAGSDKPQATIELGSGWDGAAVKIGTRFWVCTGQMGYYNCGSPYRPRKVHGQRGYAKPFTEDVEYVTCRVAGAGSCLAVTTIPDPT